MKMSKLWIGLIGLVLTGSCLAAVVGIAWYAGFFSGLSAFDPATRVAEASILADQRRDDPTVDVALIAALKDKSDSVRAAAADTLGKRASPNAGKPLVALLADPAPSVRAAAAWSLWKIPNLDPSGEAALVGAFSDKDADVRRYVFLAMLEFAKAAKTPDDPHVRQLEPLLLKASNDASPVVRRAALLALRTPPKGAIADIEPALLSQIKAQGDADETVRTFAAQGLPNTMKAANLKLSTPTLEAFASMVPTMIENVIKGDRDTRPVHQAAIVSVGKAAKTNGFRADEPTAEKTRIALVKALALPGVDVAQLMLVALPSLSTLVGSEGKFIEEQVRSAQARPELRPSCINAVKAALELAGPTDEATGKMAIDLLKPLLKDEKPMIRGTTYMALWQSPSTRKAGGDAFRAELRAVTRAQIEELKSKDAETRDVAAWCLSWTDREDADSALAALIADRSDDEPLVKTQVESSIARLEAAKKSEAWPDPSWGPFRPRPRRGGR